MHDITVSVVMITYNHEKFISEAIQGVLIQKVDFNIELIIADDCSTEDIGYIIESFKNHPNFHWIKYTKHTQNKGMMQNFIWAMKQAKGQYIALCEGDDFWTNPFKLAKQVNILNNNKDCVLSFADRNTLIDNKLEKTEFLYNIEKFDKTKIPFIHVPTLTIVFRNITSKIPHLLYKNLIDASLFLFLSQYGSFYYIKEKFGVYRIHENGVYSGNSELVNYRRSVRARIASWKYLDNVDKSSLASVLIHWISLKKNVEIQNKMIFSYISSWFIEMYFKCYLRINVKK